MSRQAQQERSFGRSVGLVLLVLGGLEILRSRPRLGAIMMLVGAVLVVCGTLAPHLLRVPSRAWWAFAHALGWVNARVLLTAFFLLILTPVGALMRLIRRGPFDLPAGARSTWTPYSARAGDLHHYEKQF